MTLESERTNELQTYINALHAATRELSTQPSLRGKLRVLITQACHFMGTPHGFIYYLTPDAFRHRASCGLFETPETQVIADRVMARIWQTFTPVDIQDYEKWRQRREGPPPELFQKVIGIPILRDSQEVAGAIILGFEDDASYSSAQYDQLQEYADWATVMLTQTGVKYQTQETISTTDRMKQVFQDAEIGIGLLGQDGHFNYANSKLCVMLGYDEQQITQLKRAQYTHPYDIQLENDLLDSLESGVTHYYQLEKRYIRKDGSTFWGRITCSIIPDGGIYHHLAVIEDITEHRLMNDELRSSERLFRTLIETVPLMVIILQGMQVLYINPMTEQITGYSREELSEHDVVEMLRVDSGLMDMSQTLIFSHNRNTVLPRQEVNITTKDGDQRWLDLTILTINLDGQVAFLITGLDITGRKNAESHALALQLEKERVSLLASFVRDASHDLRTPMSTINASLYLLGRFREDPERHSYHLGIIKEQVTRLDTLVDGLLTMTRLDSNAPLNLKYEDLAGLLDEIAENNRQEIDTRHHTLLMDIRDRPLFTQLDHTELYRAINHVVENAIRYTPDEGTIHINLHKRNQLVAITIKDNGVGIPPADVPRIFERFFRVDKSRTDSGLGLGLAIARRIIEKHAGRIEVKSDQSQGSIFTIFLPILPENQNDSHGSNR